MFTRVHPVPSVLVAVALESDALTSIEVYIFSVVRSKRGARSSAGTSVVGRFTRPIHPIQRDACARRFDSCSLDRFNKCYNMYLVRVPVLVLVISKKNSVKREFSCLYLPN